MQFNAQHTEYQKHYAAADFNLVLLGGRTGWAGLS